MWTVCDICAKKVDRAKVKYINDKFSIYYGLVICKDHFNLKVNVPINIESYIEKPPSNPKTIRIQNKNPQYADDISPNLLPGKPLNLTVEIDLLSLNKLVLRWDAPSQQGSSRLQGYVITRAEPQLSYQVVIEDNTETSATYYYDLTADITHEFTYSVAAINALGIGEFSELVYYPFKHVLAGVEEGYRFYLSESTTHISLVDGDGDYLTVLAG